MLSKLTTSITLTIIFLAILLYAALTPMPTQARSQESITPDLIIQPGDLAEALDLSLKLGDGRKVDFGPFGLSWEG